MRQRVSQVVSQPIVSQIEDLALSPGARNAANKPFGCGICPIRTLQNWEQGEREPEGPTRAYLAVIERIPEAVLAALKAERTEGIVEE